MARFAAIALTSLALVSSCSGFTPTPSADAVTNANAVGRRDALSWTAGLVAVAVSAPPASAIEACPKGSKNCLRSEWTPAAGTSRADAISQFREVLASCPQGGQNDVDGGGYTIVEDGLDGTSGVVRVEFRSAGTGTFAKFFNGGKAFVDDLVFETDPNSSSFQLRSASRVGDSDFGVNGKRVAFIGGGLKERGWNGVGLAN